MYLFLCFNLSNNYTHNMNNNYIACQLRLVYHLLRFAQNQKCWWELMLWLVENYDLYYYLVCNRYHEQKHILMPWSHSNSRASCGRSYLVPFNKWPTRNRYRNVGQGTNKKRNTMAKKISIFGKYSLYPEHGTLKW